MAYKMFGQSPSSLKTFQTCPKQFEGKYFTKEAPFVPNEKSMYGDRLHAAAQNYLVLKDQPTDEFKFMIPAFEAVKRWPGQLLVEYQVAVDKSLMAPIDWRRRCVGSKIDLVAVNGETAIIGDWKSGRSDYEDPLQVEINALGVFAAFPQVNRILGTYLYTAAGAIGRSYYFYRKDEDAAAATHANKKPLSHVVGHTNILLARMRSSHESGNFPRFKNGLCAKWCPIRSCPFNGRHTDYLKEQQP